MKRRHVISKKSDNRIFQKGLKNNRRTRMSKTCVPMRGGFRV